MDYSPRRGLNHQTPQAPATPLGHHGRGLSAHFTSGAGFLLIIIY